MTQGPATVIERQVPSRRERAVMSLLIGIILFTVTAALLSRAGGAGDFTYVWFGARSLLRGVNPYTAIGAADVPYEPKFYYPLTAAVVGLPFAWMRAPLGASLMVAITGAGAAFALTRRSWWPVLLMASAPAYAACVSGQWSFLLVLAALAAPGLGLAAAVKPNLALAMLLHHQRRRAIWIAAAGGAAVLAASLAIRPAWPVDWLRAVGGPGARQYHIPALTAYGLPLWLAVARWREPDARLLIGMAIAPQAFFFYDQLPLLLVARSRMELLTAVVISHVAALAPDLAPPNHQNAVTLSASLAPYVIVGIYWPALILVLCRRPSVSGLEEER